MTERRVMDDSRMVDGVAPTPLLRRDPPALGVIAVTGRLGSHDAGMVYAGRAADGDTEADVTLVILGEGAEADSYARARFRAAIADLEADRPGATVAGEDEEDLAPWVALSCSSWDEGLTLAGRLLQAVTLEDQAPVGVVQGPPFRPHWWERVGVGRWRLWPLPWPARLSSAGRWTFLASFAVVCAIAALALWIAVQVFQNQAPPPPGPGPGPGPIPPPSQPTSPTPSPQLPRLPTPTLGPSGGQTIPPIV